MHRFRLFSSLVGLSFSFGIAACGDDGGVPGGPDASPGVDAPAPTVDAAPGDDGSNPPVDAAPGDDGSVPPDAAPPPPTGGVVINEVVLFPLQDWSKSAGTGAPFDGTPGTGGISSRDQYIELLNTGTTPVSLVGWRIEITDSSDGAEATPLAADPETGIALTFSPGSTSAALLPGGFAVLGNPNGTVSLDALIVLKDNRGVIIDDVEIGDENENDGSDGAPAAGQNAFARGGFEEAVGRPAGQADTDNDRADFDKVYASPLGPNVAPPQQPETTAPTVAAPQGAGDWPVNQFVRAVFNERLAAANLVNGDVTLTVNGSARSLNRLTFSEGDKVLVAETDGVLPFGATVTLTLRTTITDYNGNALASQQQLSFTTEAAPANNGNVILNELCIDAQQDWDHSSGGGSPFGQTPGPGPGSLSSSDEWVELLVSANATSVDLTGYTLEVFNGPNIDGPAVQVTELDDTKVSDGELRFFGGGSLNAVPASARVVVGDPTGSISNDTYIVLRDADGNVVDEVEVGGNTPATDRGGDGTGAAGAGAPDAGLNGNATGLADETVSRRRDANGAIDTGSDTGDWVHQAATLGQPNPT